MPDLSVLEDMLVVLDVAARFLRMNIDQGVGVVERFNSWSLSKASGDTWGLRGRGGSKRSRVRWNI
jgi:hypothetical protein